MNRWLKISTFFSWLILLVIPFAWSSAKSGENLHIYAAGTYFDDSGSKFPCFWVNGRFVKLSVGDGLGGSAQCIGKVGDALVVGGYYIDESGVQKPCYWQDEKLISLPTLTNGKSGQVQSLAFDNQTILWGGSTFNPAVATDRCYWKDGTLIHWPLAPVETESVAYSIMESGGEVYLCGYCIPSNPADFPVYIPCYWRNGTFHALPVSEDTAPSGLARSMTFEGDQIWLAGYLNPLSASPTPCYWKGEHISTLPVLSPSKGGWAFSIAVSGGDIVIAGYCRDVHGAVKPCLWRNGKLQQLPIGPSGREGWANSLVTYGHDVYVAGSYRDKTGIIHPCLWKNGVRIPLSVPERHGNSAANSVFVSFD